MQTALDFYIDKIDGFADMDFQQRRDAACAAELDTKQHTKTTLKEVFRVKPKQGAISEYEYKGDYGNYIQCYTLKQCTPMRNLVKKPRTKAQNEATEALALRSRASSHRNQIALLAKECVDSRQVVAIDTETTALYGKVISIALVDVTTLDVLYDSLVYTDEEIVEEAYSKHGISSDDIKDAPSFEQVCSEISEIMTGKSWAAFNIEFDKACMENSRHDPHASCYDWFKNMSVCVMFDIAAPYFGPTNRRYGTISLSDTMACCGIGFEGRAHTAVTDAKAAARVLQYIANKAII